MEPAQHRDCDGGSDVEVRHPTGDATAADDQISENEKIEKFYALIRNYKEARDRQRIEREPSSMSVDDRQPWKKTKVENKVKSSWIPAFKWEDFNEKAQAVFDRPPMVFPTPNFNGISKTIHSGDVRDPPEVDDGELDLKLRL